MTIDYAKQAIGAEITALNILYNNLDESFLAALELLCSCSGRVVVCGMGKAGLIGQKIAATLASTGTPSFFLHPAEALHGDLGMICASDIVLLFSNSGESAEIIRILPYIRKIGAKVIAVTGNARSTLAVQSDLLLHLGKIEEACPMGLAPTATTTAMLALGDALAVCLMRRRGFKEVDYAALHPGGALGRKVSPIEIMMRVGDSVAMVYPEQTVQEVLFAITKAQSGAAIIVDSKKQLKGIFCDGDLRRGLKNDPEFLKKIVADVIKTPCIYVNVGTLAEDVLDLMREKRISEVPVVDDNNVVVGMADLKGLLASL